MSCTVIVAHNPLDRSTWQRHEEVPDLAEFLLTDFGPFYGDTFPSTARVYLESIDGEHDITPATPLAAEALHKVAGTVYVMVWPADPGTALVGFGIFVASFVIKGALGDERLRAGSIQAKARKIPIGSPNNQPGLRQNTARPNERIPDIYGQVRATPDLIAHPYITYQDNLQIETSYMCLGRGNYTIAASDVREGDTKVSELFNTSVQIYPMGQAPGGGTPQLTIGEPIGDSVITAVPIKGVTGDELNAPNTLAVYGDIGEAIRLLGNPLAESPLFQYLGSGVGTITYTVEATFESPTQQDIARNIAVGDPVGLEWTTECVSVHSQQIIEGDGGPFIRPDLRALPETIDDDHMTVTDIDLSNPSKVVITLSIPPALQAPWGVIAVYNTSGSSQAPAGTIYNRGSILYPLTFRQGPFFCNDPDMEFISVNLTAENGLWVDDGRVQRPLRIGFTAEVTPADANGNANGTKEVFQFEIEGHRGNRNFIGTTFTISPTFGGRFLISLYRDTMTLVKEDMPSWQLENRTGAPLFPWDGATTFWNVKGEFSDIVKWTHAYSLSVPPNISFGDVTTVHARVKQRRNQLPENTERKLNILALRQTAIWNGTSFTGSGGTDSGLNALFSILKDNRLGNLPNEQIDFPGIAAAFEAVDTAFGGLIANPATLFSHTFDNENSSLEDLIGAVAESCFVTVYRQGDIIKASPDIASQTSTVLFNHRNKIPGTETRAVRFGTEEEFDGIRVPYADDRDNQIKNYTIPAEGATSNPKTVEVTGIRLKSKAAMHAWRAYNEMLHRSDSVEFDAFEEALLSIVNDRILVAHNTAAEVQDGDIVAIDGTTVYTSQPVIVAGDSTLFIQHTDGTTEGISVTQGDTTQSLVLAQAPSQTLHIDRDSGMVPRYILSQNARVTPMAFRVQERTYKSPCVYHVTAYNYDNAYYFNDGLALWLPFDPVTAYVSIGDLDDRSPWETDITPFNGATATTDATRGRVYIGAVNQYLDVETNSALLQTVAGSYTVACWIYRTSTANIGNIISSADENYLRFELGLTTYALRGIHDGTVYVEDTTTPDLNTWQHFALTYDADAEEMALYINGELVDSATSVPAPTGFLTWRVFGNNTGSGGIDGRADDLRLYSLCQPPEFIRSLYQKTRL